MLPNAKPSVVFAKSAKENPVSELKPKVESEATRTKSSHIKLVFSVLFAEAFSQLEKGL